MPWWLLLLLCTDCNHFTLCLLSLIYQDLCNEKACSQGLSTEVESLNLKLQKVIAELKGATDSLNQSQERIDSLSQCLKKSESLLQLEKSRGSADMDTTSSSNSDPSNKLQTQVQETSPLVQSPETSKGCDLSSGETERQLSERLLELEKEVRTCVWIISFTGCICVSVWLSTTSVWGRWSILCWNSCSRDAWRLSNHHFPSAALYFQNYSFISAHQFL